MVMAESEAKMAEESGESSKIQQNVEEFSRSTNREEYKLEESEGSSKIQQNVEEFSWPTNREEYRLEEIIGNGSATTIYRGVYTERDEICAMKRINLENYDLTRLADEIKALKACRHPNIVSYYTSFYVGKNMWIVMRLLNRGSLRQIMDRQILLLGGRYSLTKGVLAQPIIATILKEILIALEYIHNSQLIHGDVKASNILISSEGNVQLGDFGPSVWIESEERTRKTMPGTVCYLAPEVAVLHWDDLEKDAYTFNADIWSLGITALEMVAGYPPYHNAVASMTVKWIRENTPPTLDMYEFRDYREYGRQYRHFLASCLKKHAKERWSIKKLITHPFITAKARNGEYLTHTLLGSQSSSSSSSSSDTKSSSRHLPPITDVDENLENEAPNVVWDFDIDVDEQRINRVNKTPHHVPTRALPNAELSMSISITQCVENEIRSERVLMAEDIFYNCKCSIEDQLFQLVKQRKLEPKHVVIVAADLWKVAAAAQRQDLEGKYFAFVIEKYKKFVTVLEICISIWCYITDHRVSH